MSGRRHLLARALGRHARRTFRGKQTFRQICLPPDLPAEFLVDLVIEANDDPDEVWDRETDWAIVATADLADFQGIPGAIVATADPAASQDIPGGAKVVEENNVVQWREDDRLVVYQDHGALDLESLKVFVPVIEAGYPSEFDPAFSLNELAVVVLEVCLEEGLGEDGAHAQERVVPEAADPLSEVLIFLSNAHEGSSGGGRRWNSSWFRHVEIGMEALADVLGSPEAATRDIQALVSEASFGCFSVPTPDNGATYDRRRLPLDAPRAHIQLRPAARKLADVIGDHWSSEALVKRSIQALEHHHDLVDGVNDQGGDDRRHPLAKIDWSGFDETRTGEGCVLLGLASHDGDCSGRWKAFAGLTEDQFLNPSAAIAAVGLELFLAEGAVPLRSDRLAGSLHVVDGTYTGFDEVGPFLRSPDLSVELHTGLRGAFDQDDCDGITFSVSPAGIATFVPTEEVQIDASGRLSAEGWLRVPVSENDFPYEPNLVRLSLHIPPGHRLSGRVNDSASCELVLLPPGGDGVLIVDHKGSRGIGRLRCYGPKEFHEEGQPAVEPDLAEHELRDRTSQRVLLWSSGWDEAADAFTIDGQPATRVEGRDGLWADILMPRGTNRVQAGSTSVDLVLLDRNAPFSPIIAAVHKRGHDTENQVPADIKNTARGDLEELFSEMVGDGSWDRSLGHIILPTDLNEPITELVDIDDGHFRTLEAVKSKFSQQPSPTVPEGLAASDTAERFRRAFQDLQIKKRLLEFPQGPENSPNWVSRTSWAHLAEEDGVLDAYLAAYCDLLELASTIDDASGRLWASYPFSASVWNLNEGAPGCRAILVGPLHPLRLAWLAQTEKVFREAASAGDLAGTVQSWDIPLIGPSNRSPMQMIAVPSETGEQHAFLGWSTLIHARQVDVHALEAPAFVGRRRFPTVSASAITAGAAKRALRDYLRLNPHVSTLTVELAASQAGARDSGLDRAVLEQVAEEGIVGGVRVFDSTNRTGRIPTDELANRGASPGDDTPVVWSRHGSEGDEGIESDIRFVQDTAIGVGIWPDQSEPPTGVLGPLPLRRFSVPMLPDEGSNHVTIQASLLRTGSHFSRALWLLEGGDHAPSIRAELWGAELVADSASWTVSGESLIPPVALAQLLNRRSGRASQMLWEWHPPFLATGSRARGDENLGARPYVSIARVGDRSKDTLRARLGRAMGREPDPEEVDQVLTTLGAQGIGLSSLVLMGGKDQAGALGFYTVLRLMEYVTAPDSDTFIVPLDASNQFLGALAGNRELADGRLADLLVVQARPGSVTLAPIEIKFYGIDAQNPGPLPVPGSARLSGALKQLASTVALLTAVRDRWGALWAGVPDADSFLAANALAVLVEAAMRLSPSGVDEPERAAGVLEEIASGQIELRTGRPVLAYFLLTDDPTDINAQPIVPDQLNVGVGPHAEFLANPQGVLAELRDGGGPKIQAWRDLFDTDGSGAPVIEGPTGEGPTGEGPTGEGPTGGGGGGAPSPTQAIRGEGVKFVVGRLLDSVRDAEASFWPANTNLEQLNVGVVGQSGNGKTQLLKALVANLSRSARETQPNPISILVLDYKGDFQKDDFVELVGGKVLDPYEIPLDILGVGDVEDNRARVRKSGAFIDIVQKIFPRVGPVQVSNLQDSLAEIWDSKGPSPTLADLHESYMTRVPRADGASGSIRSFVLAEVFSEHPSEFVSFEELLGDQVVVLALDKLGRDQNLKNALVALFLNQYFDYMTRRTTWPFEGEDPSLRRLNSYLVVDEAHSIMQYEFQVLEELALQCRSFGTGVLLSSQYLSHFKTRNVDYAQMLRTWFIHGVPAIGQRELNDRGLPNANEDVAQRIQELGVHEAYYSSLGFAGRFIRGKPFFELCRELEGLGPDDS